MEEIDSLPYRIGKYAIVLAEVLDTMTPYYEEYSQALQNIDFRVSHHLLFAANLPFLDGVNESEVGLDETKAHKLLFHAFDIKTSGIV